MLVEEMHFKMVKKAASELARYTKVLRNSQ